MRVVVQKVVLAIGRAHQSIALVVGSTVVEEDKIGQGLLARGGLRVEHVRFRERGKLVQLADRERTIGLNSRHGVVGGAFGIGNEQHLQAIFLKNGCYRVPRTTIDRDTAEFQFFRGLLVRAKADGLVGGAFHHDQHRLAAGVGGAVRHQLQVAFNALDGFGVHAAGTQGQVLCEGDRAAIQ